MTEIAHVCYYPEDDEGWLHIECDCGWNSGPLPDWETAADVAGDHRVEAALKATQSGVLTPEITQSEVRCFASIEVIPGVLKRCIRSLGHDMVWEKHLWVESFERVDGSPLIVEWNDLRTRREGKVVDICEM